MDSCLLCKSPTQQVHSYDLPGVTSDGRPWGSAGTLLWCPHCGHIQNKMDKDWLANIASIYKTYTTYSISGSTDQMLFHQENGTPQPRFHALIEKFAQHVHVDVHGSLLDYGCGDGHFLRSFSAYYPQWDLSGHEYSIEHQQHVLEIPAVKQFSYGEDKHITGLFDIISIQHVLEHLANPYLTLNNLSAHLKDEGLLFSQVPCFWNDPFELMIVDHSSHFTLPVFHNMLSDSGFECIHDTSQWIPKNIGFVSKYIGTDAKKTIARRNVNKDAVYQRLTGILDWLAALPENISRLADSARLGILGTSNAAVWTASTLHERVSFFVDEDPGHWGCELMGRPVISPAQTAPGDKIFAAFAPPLALGIINRLRKGSYAGQFFHVPWGLCD